MCPALSDLHTSVSRFLGLIFKRVVFELYISAYQLNCEKLYQRGVTLSVPDKQALEPPHRYTWTWRTVVTGR